MIKIGTIVVDDRELKVGNKNVLVTALQTLVIAVAAGAAGLAVGSLISGRISG